MWWKRKRDWAKRVSSMRALEAAAQPEQDYGPSWDAMLAGRREFAGLGRVDQVVSSQGARVLDGDAAGDL